MSDQSDELTPVVTRADLEVEAENLWCSAVNSHWFNKKVKPGDGSWKRLLTEHQRQIWRERAKAVAIDRHEVRERTSRV